MIYPIYSPLYNITNQPKHILVVFTCLCKTSNFLFGLLALVKLRPCHCLVILFFWYYLTHVGNHLSYTKGRNLTNFPRLMLLRCAFWHSWKRWKLLWPWASLINIISYKGIYDHACSDKMISYTSMIIKPRLICDLISCHWCLYKFRIAQGWFWLNYRCFDILIRRKGLVMIKNSFWHQSKHIKVNKNRSSIGAY